jgi:hypothetical protein
MALVVTSMLTWLRRRRTGALRSPYGAAGMTLTVKTKFCRTDHAEHL